MNDSTTISPSDLLDADEGRKIQLLEQIRPKHEPEQNYGEPKKVYPVCPICDLRHYTPEDKPWDATIRLLCCPTYSRHYGFNGSRHSFDPACRLCQLEKLDAEKWAKEQFEGAAVSLNEQ